MHIIAYYISRLMNCSSRLTQIVTLALASNHIFAKQETMFFLGHSCAPAAMVSRGLNEFGPVRTHSVAYIKFDKSGKASMNYIPVNRKCSGSYTSLWLLLKKYNTMFVSNKKATRSPKKYNTGGAHI
jgi:hypothetical protein